MPIDLTPFLDTLRTTRSTIYVAVLTNGDYDIYRDLTTESRDIFASDLSGDRIALAVFSDPKPLTDRFYRCGIAPKSWIEFREFDDRYEEETFVTDMHGRYVRVQTGMLDDMFGYVAVQSLRLPDIDTAMEHIQTKFTGHFDTHYEKLASTALVK